MRILFAYYFLVFLLFYDVTLFFYTQEQFRTNSELVSLILKIESSNAVIEQKLLMTVGCSYEPAPVYSMLSSSTSVSILLFVAGIGCVLLYLFFFGGGNTPPPGDSVASTIKTMVDSTSLIDLKPENPVIEQTCSTISTIIVGDFTYETIHGVTNYGIDGFTAFDLPREDEYPLWYQQLCSLGDEASDFEKKIDAALGDNCSFRSSKLSSAPEEVLCSITTSGETFMPPLTAENLLETVSAVVQNTQF